MDMDSDMPEEPAAALVYAYGGLENMNWYKVMLGFKVITQPLCRFVQEEFEALQEELKQTCGSHVCPEGIHRRVMRDNKEKCFVFKEACMKKQPGDPDCDIPKWLKALDEEHISKKAECSNFTAERWPTDSWEIARFFMGRGQKKKPEDTDLSGLVAAVTNCKRIRSKFSTENLSVLDEMIQSRNVHLCHNAQCGITDGDMNTCFDTLIMFVQMRQIYCREESSKKMVQNLKRHRDAPLKLINGKDEPINEVDVANLTMILRDILVEKYRQTCENIKPIPWLEMVYYNFQSVYTKLQLKPGEKNRMCKRETDIVGRKNSHDITREKMDLGSIHCVLETYTVTKTDPKTHQTKEYKVNPRRILVEGKPGVGKSTACMKLINDWAFDLENDDDPTKRTVHAFDLVFLLKARELRKEDDMCDAVINQLLGSEWKGRKRELEECIVKNPKKVLFLVDGYDEMKAENRGLSDLLNLRFLPKATVVLMARPSFMRKGLENFNAIFDIMGFSQEKQIEFLTNFFSMDHSHVDKRVVEQLKNTIADNRSVQELASNPLYLTIICHLSAEKEVEIPKSKSDLYITLEDFVIEKTARGEGVDFHLVEDLVGKLRKIAFEVLQKDSLLVYEDHLKILNFTSKEIDILRHMGFLSQDICVNKTRDKLCLEFNHKSFAEFLAAKHLVDMEPKERLSELKKMVNRPTYDEVTSFAVGVLCREGFTKERVLVVKDFVDVWAEGHYPLIAHYNHLDEVDKYTNVVKMFYMMCSKNHAKFHKILCWLCEFDLDNLQQDKESMLNIMQTITDGLGVFFFDRCRYSCYEGFRVFCDCWEILGKVCPNSMKPKMDVYLTYIAEEDEHLLASVSNQEVVDKVILRWFDWSQLCRAINALDVGGSNSSVKKLVIYTLYGPLPPDKGSIAFGNKLESLEVVQGEDLPRCVECLIAGIVDGCSVKQVHLFDCDLDDACLEEMIKKVNTLQSLESFALVEHSERNKSPISPSKRLNLLVALGQTPRLKRLDVSHVTDEKTLGKVLAGVLGSTRMERLSLAKFALGDYGMVEIPYVIGMNPHLSHVRLDDLVLHGDTDGLLTQLATLTKLEILSLLGTKTSFDGVRNILSMVVSLKELQMTLYDQESADCVAAGLHGGCQIETIAFYGRNKSSIDMQSLASSIQKLTKLRNLKFRGVKMNEKQRFAPLAQALKAHSSINVLTMRKAGLGDENLPDLLGIFANERIQHIDLNIGNSFSAEAWNSNLVRLYGDISTLHKHRNWKALGYLDIEIGDSFDEKDEVYANLRQITYYITY